MYSHRQGRTAILGLFIGMLACFANSACASGVCPVRGVLVYSSGFPVEQATVFLMKPGHSEKVARAETTADGAFAFTDSPCGKYIVAPNIASPSRLGALYATIDSRKPGEIRITIPDDSRLLSNAPPKRPESQAPSQSLAQETNVTAGPSPPSVPIDGNWHWGIESRIRRDTVERLGGSKAVAEYDKLPEQERIRKFLETFGNELTRMEGIQFNDPKKLRAEWRAKTWWTSIAPLPPQVESAILAAINRRAMQGPNLDELGKENMAAALAVVKATAPNESTAKVEAEFEAADPIKKTNMFLMAIRAQMKARVWPSAFLLAMAYLPGDVPHKFITQFDPSDAAGWESKNRQERAEAAWRALQILIDKLENAAADETGATWKTMSQQFGLNPPNFSGPNSIRRVFGNNLPDYQTDPALRSRYIAAAGIFHTLWLVEAAIYY